MSPTPYFAGGNEKTTHRAKAQRTAKRLAKIHPELGYSVLWSATSYLLRDGWAWPLRDETVVGEARRRLALVERAVKSRRWGR